MTFSVGSLEGNVSRGVTLVTTEPDRHSYNLRLDVDIPKMVSIEPQFMAWAKKDGLRRQTITLRSQPGATLEFVGVSGSQRLFQTEVKTEREVILLSVTPIRFDAGVDDDLGVELKVNGVIIKRTVLLRMLASSDMVDPLPAPAAAKPSGKAIN